MEYKFMKRFFLTLVAFFIGVMVSVTIHACAKDEGSGQTENGSSNGNSCNCGTVVSCNCDGDTIGNLLWENQPKAAYITYDEFGEISNEQLQEYDEQVRPSRMVQNSYSRTATGKRYLSSRSITTYTYSGVSRFAITEFVGFDEYGKETYRSSWNQEVILYTK